MLPGSNHIAREHDDPDDPDSDDDFQISYVNPEEDSDHDEGETAPKEACIRRFVEDLMTNDTDGIRTMLKNDFGQILDKYPDLPCQSELDGRTVLHRIVDDFPRMAGKKDSNKNLNLKQTIIFAVMTITSRHPELLAKPANNGITPLYRVIVSCCAKGDEDPMRSHLMRQMIFKCKRVKTDAAASTAGDARMDDGTGGQDSIRSEDKTPHPLTEALKVKCTSVIDNMNRSENVLHLAMRHHWVFASQMKALVRLASNASEETIVEKDGNGFSPLHYAVNYEWSSQEQLTIVKHLIQNGESAALIERRQGVLDLTTKDGLSAYRYHMLTRERAQKQPSQHPNNTAAWKAPGIRRAMTGGLKDVENAAVQREQMPDSRDEREEWSEELQILLKVECLRTRKHEVANRLLYGDNLQDIQTWFDYQGAAKEVDEQAFQSTFENVTFESVLKYVAFPPVRIRKTKSRNSSRRPVVRRGRSDMEFFFNWLREKKGVKRILKVIVEDSVDEPHSDEAIEKALNGFGVLSLDWSKPDLDPEALYKASPGLTDVVLHWTGNNAILRAWGEPKGLRRLLQLRKIEILVDQTKTLESRERLNTNLRDLGARLKEQCPDYLKEWAQKNGNPKTKDTPATGSSKAAVTMGPPPRPYAAVEDPTLLYHPVECHYDLDAYFPRWSDSSIPPSGHNGDRNNILTPPHIWLGAVDDFAERISNVWERIIRDSRSASQATNADSAQTTPANTSAPRGNALSNTRAPEDVIVALIDDGVDTMAEQLSGRMLPGRTFGFEGDRNLPWYASETGHGTVMATMISRVCPMAKIYPIRLNMGAKLTAGAGAMINVDSAAQAIRAAVDRKATIISISWTVGIPKSDTLGNAIQYALDNDVLLFCSSRDSGHGTGIDYYPAGFRRDAVIKIGAAEPSGSPYDWAGPIENLDFIFPGVEVVQRHTFRGPTAGASKEIREMEPKTGSSVATALGAGLAALVIYCARINQMYAEGEKLSDADVAKLRRSAFMIQAIRNFGMSTSDVTKNKFVEVWRKLDDRTQRLAQVRADSNEARKIVAQLARDLIPVV
ncbi:Cell wall-associated protease [Colletotrichum spinosum]|nr:Cell wall-associated protease [Colletotrichum spinosum]